MPAEKIQIDKAVIFANENNQNAKKAVDGSFFSKWVGGQCPGYFEITLPGAFRVARLKLDAGKRGYSIFSVFASEDAENFSEVITQDSEAVTNGKYDFECGFVCRKIRIYIKYNSFSPYAQLKNIELFGEKTEKCKEKASPDFPCDFKDSKFNVAVTDKDTEDELHALVARTVGEKYSDCFIFEVLKSGEEFFELSDENGKIKIKGSNGVNIAYGLNHYYKYFCKVHISQAGNRTEMPDKLPEIGGKIKMSTPFPVRYAYNYCALSYTMAFMGEKEWQKELDWLALQGVNAVLDITAAEEVYRRFLMKIGYSLDEAKAFITGPAYYAWFNMANIFGVGGPLHSTFFKKHTELARKNHLFMRKMGMQPVLQGYSGMVPQDIASHFEGAPVIPQGLWNCLERPYMLKTDTDVYRSFARIFYECQRDVFGEVSHFYATDPFHEGGKSGSLKIENVGRQIIESILESDPDGIWIIQSWGENPSKALMDGIGNKKEHALVLDLYAEKKPRWETFLGGEFADTPWVYCMLNNFGGRMGLHGHLRTIASEIARAAEKAKYMRGVGITPEATHSNPLIFDMIYETTWSKSGMPEKIDVESWLRAYAERRYGECTDSIFQALLILNDTVYNPELNENGEGAPESVINARPSNKVKSPSTWGNDVVAYDKKKLEKAAALFAENYDRLCGSEGYLFDLADLLKQVLSNTAQEYQRSMAAAFDRRDRETFKRRAEKFTGLIEFTDEVLSLQKEFLLGSWINQAKRLSEGCDDFTKKIFEWQAKAQITTWAGSRLAADDGGLKDYSNKQWAGLTRDFYLMRWKKWIENAEKKLSGKKSEKIDWFRMENRWTWERKEYTETPSNADYRPIIRKVLTEYGADSAEK